MKPLAALVLLLAAADPADAGVVDAGDMVTVTAARPGITPRQRAVPAQLSPAERDVWRQVFLDIAAGRLSRAESAMAGAENGLLAETARAQLILARGGGKASRAELCAWLERHKDLPQASRIAEIAARLPGADAAPLPLLPAQRPFRTASYAPLRLEAGPLDANVGASLKALLAQDRNAEAEMQWQQAGAGLSPWARTDWAQRIAWSYYGQNDNDAALRMGLEAARGSTAGQSAALGAWTAGLAAFRLQKWQDAALAFDAVADLSPPADLSDAAAYWAGRAWLAAGHPEKLSERLERAARNQTGFYGLLARRALGLGPLQDWREPDFITADWNVLKDLPGARRAAALAEVGQIGLADRELRHLAVTAPAEAYPAILRLASRLDLPATQYSLAVRPPVGIDPPLSARWPAPDWTPARGWRVDRSLVFAHALQESSFVTTATSRAGARGVMQLMPATGRQVADQIRATAAEGSQAVVGDLTDPEFNIEVGQTYLEALRDMSYTQGLLPKVIAAYNAGPGSVQRWNTSLDDRGDPLLFIESIPFRETRHYVEVVMRNLWMYQLRDGGSPSSMEAIAANLWPRFPGLPGASAVKLPPHPVQAAPSVVPPPAVRTPSLSTLPDDEMVTASAGGN